MESAWLREALGLSEGETPFPWQERLLERFKNGKIDRWLDIPTGLGKTGVMAIWLVGRACGAPLPRRLVYIVDRRAVVDQATDVAMGLRGYVDRDPALKRALGLEGGRSLPISTLRGQHVDNREWLEDPASPAIIVGTLDMIGSRLLFEGYGVSREMRPYHDVGKAHPALDGAIRDRNGIAYAMADAGEMPAFNMRGRWRIKREAQPCHGAEKGERYGRD